MLPLILLISGRSASASVERGSREAAEEFDVSPFPRSNGLRLTERLKLGGQAAGGSTSALEKHGELWLTPIERQSDLTLDERWEPGVLRKQGIRSSRTSVVALSGGITSRSKKPRRGGVTRHGSTGASALDASTGLA